MFERKDERVNLLILSNNPSRASFRQRIGLYLPYLSSAGISWKVEKLPAGYLQRSRLFQKAREYDGVLLHKKTLNVLDAFLLGHYARTVLYDFDDAVMYGPSEVEKHFNSHIRPFRRTVRLAKMVFAGNEYLADHARPFCRDVRVVPTGLDVKVFDGLQKTKSEPLVRLVWIGSRSTLSYLERISPVLERIGRRYSNTILRIIADAFIDLDSMRVEKCFWTEELQNQQLIDADIGLAPLPENRFTKGKCGFKILQYFAAGLPVAASPVGVNSDLLRQSGAGVPASTDAQWEEALQQLIENKSLRESYGQKGKVFVKQYDREVIGKQFCSLILDAMRS